jgi:hypothetical protein
MTIIYKPLKNHQIRLLVVVPGSNPNDLRFKFWHVSVTEQTPYTAVSYVWNHEPGNEVIHVDNQVLFIKRNLWKSLQRLRLIWRCIWADAICINQSNVEEVNHQVGMMGRIYANADVVSVWLGDAVQGHKPPEEARERQASTVSGVLNKRLVPSLASFMFDHPAATDEDELSQNLAQSIYEIARALYWRRAWIIQEFLLARRIHIYYGDARIDEAVFRAVLMEQVELKRVTPDPSDKTESTNLLNRGQLLAEWPPLVFVDERQLRTRTQMKRPFYDLLAEHANAECWEPKDMVFSLLSLINAIERRMLDRCFPDYSFDFMIVALVALAHLKYFAGDKPLQPLLRALKLETSLTDREYPLLFHLLRSFDYVGSSNPAADGHNLRREFELAHRDVNTIAIEDYTQKLARPDMTLNGLYHSPHSSNQHGEIEEGVSGAEQPRREIGPLPIGMSFSITRRA